MALACYAALAADDPVSYVDPFVGTTATGHTFPGACVPFGLVQASPDTGTESWHYCSGYRYEDKSIRGFSHSHLNGTGGLELGDLLILPFSGDAKEPFAEAIDKSSEKASPGYYAVRLSDSDIRAEVSASEHAAIYRLTYGGKGKARLLVDAQWGVVMKGTLKKYVREGEMKVRSRTCVVGRRRTSSWNEREIGFAVLFDRPYSSVTELPARDGEEKIRRLVFDFDLKPGEALSVKVGLAAGFGSDSRWNDLDERAKRNLAAEIPGWDFEAVRTKARAAWNDRLGSATIEGSEEEMKNWYTSLYHLFVQPNNLADVGERPFYSTLSCWDTFRAAGPLYTLLCPDKAAAFVDSMLRQGQMTGYLPIWTLWGRDNQCMIGTHSIPMIADAYLKGLDGLPDLDGAYAQIKETLTKRHEGRVKEDWDLYDAYGYYPFDKINGESVSRTLECCYDDWCAAQLAKALGKDADAAFFMKRADYWKNVLDKRSGFVRGRDSRGNWREPFDPFAFGHGAGTNNDFTEGNAFQYTWHVLHDPDGLVAEMGGREATVKRLQALFKANEITGGAPPDVTGLIGQYVHGNEPSHHVIYLFSLLGEPHLTADYVREVFDRFYRPKPDGLCGNDDCGQMSAWYLFSAMGLYPFNPCGGEYVLGAPQVPKVEVEVEKRGGQRKVFTVVAKGLSKENKYVKSVTLNGKPVVGRTIRHADIVAGGTLVFEMESGKR